MPDPNGYPAPTARAGPARDPGGQRGGSSGCEGFDGRYDSREGQGRDTYSGPPRRGLIPHEGRNGQDQLGDSEYVPETRVCDPTTGEACSAPQQPVMSPAKKIRPGCCGAATLGV
jgi:hypothetical protein